MFANKIQWYENKALDNPKLRSPTPCPRGVYCQYKLPNKDTKELELACCRMVHPGEEGNGRRLFPARTAPDGREQPACVRLTGKAGFYERCRLKQPWRVWATEHGIPLPPTDVPWVQVERAPIGRERDAPPRLAQKKEASAELVSPLSATPSSGWPALEHTPKLLRLCESSPLPPPRLNLGGISRMGMGDYDSSSPMEVWRRAFAQAQEGPEDEGDRTPCLAIPWAARVGERIAERAAGFVAAGSSQEAALLAAQDIVHREIQARSMAQNAEGGMEELD